MEPKEQQIIGAYKALMQQLQDAKSEERTNRDRSLAICYTLLEQSYAFFLTFVSKVT